MNITTNTEGSKATLEAEGKLTAQTAPELEAAIAEIDQSVTELNIDLAQVDYIASAGLRVLVAAEKMLTSRGGSMTILHPCDDVNDVFEMTGLAEIFTIVR